MHIGHYISGSAHIGLLGWMLLGGVFQSEQLPVDVSNVSVVSLSEYADIVMTDRAPEAELQPQDLMQPETEADPLPERPSQEQAVENIPQPELMVQPEETSRSAPQTPDPLLIPTPEVTEPTKLAAPQSNDAAFIVPRSAPAPRPQPDKRIAPKPVAPPPPDVAQEDQLRQAAAPSENPAAVPQPEVDATAPEEAARESLAETDTPPKMAPDSSVRPQARPALPEPPKAPEPSPEIANQSPAPVQAPKPKPRPEAEPEPTPKEDPIQAALQEAMQGGSEPSEAEGPALTKDEKEGLRDDVQACWIVDEGSLVSNVTVTVAVSMTPEGKVKGGSLRLISGEGGSDRAKKIAFEAARRAILRCQKKGYDLPKEKYEHWREIEIIFDPESRTR
ncbi:energy transducer TonB [Rhodobacteraceae bacterium]|nr:energy transducer TonB [Paracoccaceae bacterium]